MTHRKILILTLLLTLASATSLLHAQFYNWPCTPFDQPHWINGTFCENRPSGSIQRHHFHDGVDIHLPGGTAVYSVISGTVTGIGTRDTYGINAYVRVGRYAYVHVDPYPGITVGSTVTAFETVIGTTNSWNHIHFKDGNPGQEINALRENGGLSPFDDPYDPLIEAVYFYVNSTSTRFSENKVNGLVEIVAKAQDKTDTGPLGSNNGTYAIGYRIFDAEGTTPLTDPIQNFLFNQIPPSDSYITNVFFEGSDISNYYYTITNRITADGYWDTRSYDPGTYQVQVFTEDPYGNRDEVWRTVEVTKQDVYPPAVPVLSGANGNDQKQWILSWLPNDSSDVSGYNFYFSYFGDSWTYQPYLSDDLTPQDTSLTMDNFSNDINVYFRLSALDSAAVTNESDTSDAYGVRLSADGPDVLIVDGFDRTDGYWKHPAHTFVVRYGEILAQYELAFNSCSDDALISGRFDMNDYPMVIYFTGDNLGTPRALDAAEQTLIQDYLGNGGKLILTGTEIGADLLAAGSSSDSLFFSEYLKSDLSADSSGSLILQGTAGDHAFSGYSGQLAAPAGNDLRCDVLTANGAQALLTYESGTAAVFYQGTFPGGSGDASLFYAAFPIELVSDEASRIDLMGRIFQLFDIPTAVIPELHPVLADGFELLDNYPNPFNPSTRIRYRLPVQGHVTVSVYSTDGRLIRTLVDARQGAGLQTIRWDGTDDQGSTVSSGVYIYRVQGSGFDRSGKMVLVR